MTDLLTLKDLSWFCHKCQHTQAFYDIPCFCTKSSVVADGIANHQYDMNNEVREAAKEWIIHFRERKEIKLADAFKHFFNFSEEELK